MDLPIYAPGAPKRFCLSSGSQILVAENPAFSGPSQGFVTRPGATRPFNLPSKSEVPKAWATHHRLRLTETVSLLQNLLGDLRICQNGGPKPFWKCIPARNQGFQLSNPSFSGTKTWCPGLWGTKTWCPRVRSHQNLVSQGSGAPILGQGWI